MHERRLVGARLGNDNTRSASTAALPVLSPFSVLRRNALLSSSSRSPSQRLRRAQGFRRTDLVGWWCLAQRRANQASTFWCRTSKSAATLSRIRYTFYRWTGSSHSTGSSSCVVLPRLCMLVLFGSVPIVVCTAAVLHPSCIVVLIISVPLAVFVASAVSAAICSDRMPVERHDAMSANAGRPKYYASSYVEVPYIIPRTILPPSWLTV